jgi:hypothetical protein
MIKDYAIRFINEMSASTSPGIKHPKKETVDGRRDDMVEL